MTLIIVCATSGRQGKVRDDPIGKEATIKMHAVNRGSLKPIRRELLRKTKAAKFTWAVNSCKLASCRPGMSAD
jgi:hypothetical protein